MTSRLLQKKQSKNQDYSIENATNDLMRTFSAQELAHAVLCELLVEKLEDVQWQLNNIDMGFRPSIPLLIEDVEEVKEALSEFVYGDDKP